MMNKSKVGQHMNDTRTLGEPKMNSLWSPNEMGKDVSWNAAWNKQKRRPTCLRQTPSEPQRIPPAGASGRTGQGRTFHPR